MSQIRWKPVEHDIAEEWKEKRLLERAAQAARIVGLLSACDEPRSPLYGDCTLCGNCTWGVHEPDCPWHLAREWMHRA